MRKCICQWFTCTQTTYYSTGRTSNLIVIFSYENTDVNNYANIIAVWLRLKQNVNQSGNEGGVMIIWAFTAALHPLTTTSTSTVADRRVAGDIKVSGETTLAKWEHLCQRKTLTAWLIVSLGNVHSHNLKVRNCVCVCVITEGINFLLFLLRCAELRRMDPLTEEPFRLCSLFVVVVWFYDCSLNWLVKFLYGF